MYFCKQESKQESSRISAILELKCRAKVRMSNTNVLSEIEFLREDLAVSHAGEDDLHLHHLYHL